MGRRVVGGRDELREGGGQGRHAMGRRVAGGER